MISNLFKSGAWEWSPDADSVNAPDGVLLRADNLVPDPMTGVLSLRRGSATVYTGLQQQNLNQLHTVELADSVTYRVQGADDRVLINGVDAGAVFDGSGDLAIGDDAYQVVMARGTVKKKWDGTTLNNWGIAKPLSPPTLAAVTAITSVVSEFDNAESPLPAINEGTLAYTTDFAGTANKASQLTPVLATGRATISRLWTSDQDYLDIKGTQGTDTDLFDISVKMEDPRRVDKIKVVFGLDNNNSDPFVTDRYEFEFDLKNAIDINIKDPTSEGYGSYEAAVRAQLNAILPSELSRVQTPAQVKATISAVGTSGSAKTSGRPDADVWGHLSITRGQFKRIGNTAGRDWNTVRGFKLVYTVQSGYQSKLTISDALYVGGGDRSLTGTFRCVIRGVRSAQGTIKYQELGPPSEQSEEINLNHQTLQVTISAATLSNFDPQVDQIWVYLFGGFLDTYYRFAIASRSVRSGLTIDELTNPAGSDFDTAGERTRLTTHGFTVPGDTGSGTVVLTLEQSELGALTENERLEPYQSGPPDNIMAIAGPWNGRMFTLTTEGYVYPSSNRSPSSFNTLQVIDLTRYGDPLWMVKTGSGITVGMEKDVIRLQGSGDDSPDLTIMDLYPEPLNVGNPPCDSCVYTDGNAVIYRSVDGLMMLVGQSLQPIPVGSTSLLWRGQGRHDVLALNTTTGRFRCAVDNQMLYVLAPEGTNTSGNVIYRYSMLRQKWSRLTFPQVTAWYSIHKEPDGTLIAGTTEGEVWQLETGTQDDGANIPITIRTPISDAGNGLVRKDAFDLQMHADTGSLTATVFLFKDGSPQADATTYSLVTNQPQVYRVDASPFGVFIKAQMLVTGSFYRFIFHGFNLSFRERPQHSYALDTGYILPAEPGRRVWAQRVEFDAIAESNVTMEVYRDDVLWHSATIMATPGVRKVYLQDLPRGTNAQRLRIFFRSVSTGTGELGFDLYSVKLRTRSTGNQDGDRQYLNVYPAGAAA